MHQGHQVGYQLRIGARQHAVAEIEDMSARACIDGTTTVIDHGPGGLLGGRPTGQ